MKNILFLFLVLFMLGCSGKIELDNEHQLNPLVSPSGITIIAVHYNGILFGKTPSMMKEKILKEFPDAVGIYVDSNNPFVFYVMRDFKDKEKND